MQVNDVTLKPCPFCGAEIRLYTPAYCEGDDTRKSIDHPLNLKNPCLLSSIGLPHFDKDEVIEAWNKRYLFERPHKSKYETVGRILTIEFRSSTEVNKELLSNIRDKESYIQHIKENQAQEIGRQLLRSGYIAVDSVEDDLRVKYDSLFAFFTVHQSEKLLKQAQTLSERDKAIDELKGKYEKDLDKYGDIAEVSVYSIISDLQNLKGGI